MYRDNGFHALKFQVLLTCQEGAANGVFAVRVAPLQKAKPAAAVEFLYRARMVLILQCDSLVPIAKHLPAQLRFRRDRHSRCRAHQDIRVILLPGGLQHLKVSYQCYHNLDCVHDLLDDRLLHCVHGYMRRPRYVLCTQSHEPRGSG